MNRLLISATIFSLSLWATGCKNEHKDTEAAGHHKMADQNMQMAMADVEPTKGNTAKGTVKFMQMGDKVHVKVIRADLQRRQLDFRVVGAKKKSTPRTPPEDLSPFK